MPLYFFTVPALDPGPAQDELNRFCEGQRVVAVDRQFVAAGLDSYWALCVTVSAGAGSLPDALKAPERRAGARGAGRVDYKLALSAEDFARYADLRDWRKAAAEQDGVPVYQVFTNEQLAECVRRRVGSLAALGEIEGIGAARLERYGAALLARLQADPTAPAPPAPAAQ
jgi:superfamily II DNA helicase RecQ